MTIKTSSFSGGGSLLKPVAFTSARVAAGASGAVVTATAGANQYIKLTYLMTGTATTESGMTLTVDGVDLFSGESLSDFSPSAQANGTIFGVATGYGNTSVQLAARLLKEINCLSFTLTKDTGTTLESIDYAYETMEAL
jgi:hypothetical protein